MLYFNGTSSASLRAILHKDKTKAERAALAARILDNRIPVVGLTVAQLAILCGTTPSAISKKRVSRANRRRKLSLAAINNDVTDAEVDQIVVALGVERVMAALDRATAPAMAAEG